MALFNSLTFDGVNSLDSGIYITGEAVYNAPQRQVEMITIPGRNGTLAIDQGRFENIEVTYPAGCFADDQSDFASKIMEFRNELASRFGYKRLVDTYHPDEFRLGTYSSGLEVGAVAYHQAGEFDITFDCKPQRFLVSGEEAVTIGEWGETETATGDIVEIDNPDGILGVKSLLVTLDPIQDLHGYDKPWVGGAGKNLLGFRAINSTLNGVTFVSTDEKISITGTATANTSPYAGSESTAWEKARYGPYPAGQYTVEVKGFTPSVDTDRIVFNAVYEDGSKIEQFPNGVRISEGAVTFTATAPFKCGLWINITSGSTINSPSVEVILNKGSAIESWTPYENICPISGRTEVVTQRTGKNLLPTGADGYTNTRNGITATFNSDGSVSLNGTATATAMFNLISNTALQNKLYLPQGDYILNGESVADNNFWIGAYRNADSGAWPIRTKTSAGAFSVGEGDYIFPRIRIGSGVVLNNVTIYPMIRLASDTDATYEPYQGETYTTALGRTVYGGTLDVVSGELVVDRAMVDLGSLNYSYNATYTMFLSTIDNMSQSPLKTGLCSQYKAMNARVSSDEWRNGDGLVTFGGSDNFIRIKDTRYTDPTAFKTAMNGVQLVYELASPQTIQLTPQQIDLLLGTNNVWSDGRITVEYGLLPNIIVNPTLFASNPLLVVTGAGTLSIGNQTLTIASGSADQEIYIDCDSQEAWEIVGGGKLSRNDYIQNAGEVFPVLNPGANAITLGTGITQLDITPRWWRV